MNKFALLSLVMVCVSSLCLMGCDDGSNAVIEAPPEAVEEQPAIEGMTDEEYNQAMDAEMNG